MNNILLNNKLLQENLSLKNCLMSYEQNILSFLRDEVNKKIELYYSKISNKMFIF